MKNTITKLMQDLAFKRMLNNLNIEPAPLFDAKEVNEIEVNEPEVVKYNRWMRDTVKSEFYSNHHAMTRGYERVANHKIEQFKIRDYE